MMQPVIVFLLLLVASSLGSSRCLSDTEDGGGAGGGGGVVGYGYRIESVAFEPAADAGKSPSSAAASSLRAHLRLIKRTSIFGPDVENLHLVAG